MHPNFPSVFIVFAVCTVLGLVSCNDPNSKGSETYSYTIQQKNQLMIDSTSLPQGKDSSRTVLNISTEAGNNLVFKYRYNKMSPSGVAEGGYSETVYFEIPTGKKQIELEDSSLKEADVYYTHSCYCPRMGAVKITDGTIKGEQLSPGKWYINASLTVKFPYFSSDSRSVSFKHLFRPQ